MFNLDIKNYLYHGIVDWLNYDKNFFDENLCLEKLNSILEKRFIIMPRDFEKFGVKHNDTANPYTYHFTFLACSPKSVYASRLKKEMGEDNGYMVATVYSKFGILLNPTLLNELIISDISFCGNEILIEDNISLDKYGIGIYINALSVSESCFQIINESIKNNGYNFSIVSVFDGKIIESIIEEKNRVKRLELKLLTQS